MFRYINTSLLVFVCSLCCDPLVAPLLRGCVVQELRTRCLISAPASVGWGRIVYRWSPNRIIDCLVLRYLKRAVVSVYMQAVVHSLHTHYTFTVHIHSW